MTNLGIGLGKPLAQLRCPRTLGLNYRASGSPGAMCLMESMALLLGVPRLMGEESP